MWSALCPSVGVERWRSRSSGGSSWRASAPHCGYRALALQILRGILVQCPLPPVGVERWRSRSSEGSSWSASASPCGCGALALQILRGILVERFGATVGQCHGGGLLAERPWPWKPKAPEHPSAPQLKGATQSLEEKNFENKKKLEGRVRNPRFSSCFALTL